MMQLHYVLQTLFRGRGSNLLKVISLSLALTMSILLFSRIAFELSYDNFYRQPENLYIIKTGWMKDGVLNGNMGNHTIQALPGALAESFPTEVESVTTCFSFGGSSYRLGATKHVVPTVMGDTLFFDTMGLNVLEGNPQELASPDVVFLSATAARRIFGSENPLGQTLIYNSWSGELPLLVKGIFEDIPLNTVLNPRPEAILSFTSISRHSWARLGWNSGGNFEGYVRLRPGTDADALSERLSAAIAQHIPEESGLELRVGIAPLHNQHLNDGRVRKMIWIMALLGVVLLFTTALNYVLISVASLTRRAKAIGVHKCSGASGGSIFSMFMLETAVVILLALAFIGMLVYVFKEKMEELAAVPLDALFAWQNLWAPAGVVTLLFVLGGCLPAMLFARIPVTQVFSRYTSGRRGWKRVLLLVQFGGAAFIVGMMLLVYTQYAYVTGRDRGFRAERVAYVNQHLDNPAPFMSLLRGLPYVESVASALSPIFGFYAPYVVADNEGRQSFSPRSTAFDADFMDFMGLKLAAGQGLTGQGELLVNGPFVRKMGWEGSGVGRRVSDLGTVVGVLGTFSFPQMPDDATPVLITFAPGVASVVHVRLKPPFAENLERLNEEMRQAYPQDELMFRSLEAEIRSFSESVRVFRDVTLLASVTILFIILMGLIGYVNDEVQLRSKEIAIRKVNGAEAGSVLRLLSRDVLWLALPAVALGTLGAWKAGQVWVGQFSDAVTMPVVGYVAAAAGLIAFIIGIVVIKAWRIANENPVKSIKSE